MLFEPTRLYRVRAVADAMDVSSATIYRAVDTGALRAIRIGTGKGAIRIFGEAATEYLASCQSAAATRPPQQDKDSGEFEFAAGGAA